MRLTDEMVEVAVDGAVKALWSAPDNAPAQATLIRAALTAVLPRIRDGVLEEAAKVALGEMYGFATDQLTEHGVGYRLACKEIAAVLRAMKGSADGEPT